jgi:hypothetical protein
MLIEPAGLVQKTQRERIELSKHWRIPTNLMIESYEKLGRVAGANILDIRHPDVIIFDECHRVKNKRAAVTRRFSRYFRENPDTIAISMSGTVMKSGIRDFAHILGWAMKNGSPLPLEESALMEWAEAIDEKMEGFERPDPGVLLDLMDVDITEDDPLIVARRAVSKRLLWTPGIMATAAGDTCDCSLSMRGVEYDIDNDEHFKTLRTLWETPDGFALSEAVEVWRHARELALGLIYRWDPAAPQEWLAARRAWASFARETLAYSHKYDSELQVANAVDAGHLDDSGTLNAWRKIKDTFTINSKPIWYDPGALEFAEAWGKKAKDGIIWTEHHHFAEELSRRTGWAYYGAGGLNKKGEPIPEFTDQKSGKGIIIASVAANGTGRNLQRWHKNLITSPSRKWEQLLGRTHREGQTADNVSVDIMIGCRENIESIEKSIDEAKMVNQLTDADQKLLSTDIEEMSNLNNKVGFRWTKNK